MGPRPSPFALWRVLAVFLVAFSAASSILIGGVAAATGPACTLDASSGVVGQNIAVSCTGFSANETVRVYWDAKTISGQMGSFTANGSGAGSGTYPAKDSVSGSHTIYAVGQTSATETTAAFTIVPNMVMSSASGKVGTSLSITLTGFGASESIAVSYAHDVSTSVVLKTVVAGTKGRAIASTSVPKSVAGAHAITADGAVATSDPSATFTVVPSVELTPATGTVNRNVSVKLDGFATSEAITLNWVQGGVPTPLTSVNADLFGSTTATIAIPTVAKGPYDVQADGATNDAVATYTVAPTIDFSQNAYVVHGEIPVTLAGFPANTAVDIKWYDGNTAATASAVVATTTTGADGTASVAVEVPDAVKGWHRVEAVAGSDVVARSAWVKPSIALDPATGETGDTVTAHLHGYEAGETVAIVWAHSVSSSTTVVSTTVNGSGSGDVDWVVPADPNNGNHTVTGDGAADANTIFVLANPVANPPADCTLQYPSGPVGSELRVDCVAYDAGETVTVHLDSAGSAALGNFVADQDGEGSVTIVVPSTSNGAHTIVTKGATSLETTSDAFTVGAPDCTLTDSNATPGVQGVYGDEIGFSCTGFRAGDLVQVYWDTTTGFPRAAVNANASGEASGTFTIPDATKGAHTVITKTTAAGFAASDTVTVDPLLTVASASAAPNTSISTTLKGFGNKESVVLAWVDGASVTTLKTVTTLTNGSLSTTFQVPIFPAKTTYKLRATGQTTGAVKEVSFAVVAGMMLSPNTAMPTSNVTATVRGFKANEAVTLKFYQTESTTVTLNIGAADANGVYSYTFSVPNAVTGLHKVEAVGGGGSLVSRDFTVSAGIQLAKSYGVVGSTVTVTLNGWGSSEKVKVEWENNGVWSQVSGSPFTMNSLGRAQFVLTIPETFQGEHTIRATGLTGSIVKTRVYTVNPSIALSPTFGPVGTTVTATLKGYGAGETVTLRYFISPSNSVVVATKIVGANGSGTVTFAVPSSSVAKHKVTAAGASSGASAYVYFEVR